MAEIDMAAGGEHDAARRLLADDAHLPLLPLLQARISPSSPSDDSAVVSGGKKRVARLCPSSTNHPVRQSWGTLCACGGPSLGLAPGNCMPGCQSGTRVVVLRGLAARLAAQVLAESLAAGTRSSGQHLHLLRGWSAGPGVCAGPSPDAAVCLSRPSRS